MFARSAIATTTRQTIRILDLIVLGAGAPGRNRPGIMTGRACCDEKMDKIDKQSSIPPNLSGPWIFHLIRNFSYNLLV